MSLNVLIVDDSATMRGMVARTLEMCGLPVGEVLQAANGREALDTLADHWVDLVLTDINMPVMDGVSFLKELRASGLLETLPVVVISTEGSETRIAELKELGVNAYLRKPFAPEALRTVLEGLLEYSVGQ